MGDNFVEAATELLTAVRQADGRSPDGPPDPQSVDALEVDYSSDDGPAGSRPMLALGWRQSPGDPAELYVHPAARRRGLGRRMAERLLANGSGGLWAHGTLPAATALAATLNLLPRRELLQMRAPLPVNAGSGTGVEAEAGSGPEAGLVSAGLPDGVVLRTMEPGADDAEFLRVNAAAFSWHPEQGRLTQSDLDADMREEWFDPAGFFLAVPADDAAPGGRVYGFHWTKVHPAAPPVEPEPLGEIYVLAVDPDSPVRHLGGPLAIAGLTHLATRGLGTALLYVESDNQRAVALYRRLGFEIHAVDTVFS